MKPLPESFESGTAFWERMEVQPKEGYSITLNDNQWAIVRDSDGAVLDLLDAPYTVGDTLYRREEWRVTYLRGFWVEVTIRIEYRDGNTRKFRGHHLDNPVSDDLTVGAWQPASTMPSWVARELYTVVSVEAKQLPGSTRTVKNNTLYDLGWFRNIGGPEIPKCFPWSTVLNWFESVYGEGSWDRNDWGWYVTVEAKKPV